MAVCSGAGPEARLGRTRHAHVRRALASLSRCPPQQPSLYVPNRALDSGHLAVRQRDSSAAGTAQPGQKELQKRAKQGPVSRQRYKRPSQQPPSVRVFT